MQDSRECLGGKVVHVLGWPLPEPLTVCPTDPCPPEICATGPDPEVPIW